jgi:selenocysteine lyase/cysteine desulfurase
VAAAVRAFQCHARPGRPIRDRFTAKVKAVLGARARVSPASAPDGRVVALELAGMDVYPVYRALAERGVAVKCVKTRGKTLAGEGVEVLRIGFPWWADDADIDRAVELLGSVVDEMEEVPPLAGRAPQERGQLRAVSMTSTRRAVEAL